MELRAFHAVGHMDNLCTVAYCSVSHTRRTRDALSSQASCRRAQGRLPQHVPVLGTFAHSLSGTGQNHSCD